MKVGMGGRSGGCHPRLMSGTPLGCVPTITRTDVLAGPSTTNAFFCVS
jgi:hypothetical protein